MSSALRSYAQTAPRASFLLTTCSGARLYITTFPDSVVNLSRTVPDLSLNKTVSANTLLRDMGRSLTMYVSTGAGDAVKVGVLREVQIVNGKNTEGVSDTTAYLVPVWLDENPEPAGSILMAVEVVRCG